MLYCLNYLNLSYITVETVFSIRDYSSNSANQILWNKENTWEFSTGKVGGFPTRGQWAIQADGADNWFWHTAVSSFNQNTKYHLVVTWDTDFYVRTYLNGTLVDTYRTGADGNMYTTPLKPRSTWPKLNARNSGQNEVGDPGSHDYYRFAVWNRSLNQSDITSLYNNARTRHGF